MYVYMTAYISACICVCMCVFLFVKDISTYFQSICEIMHFVKFTIFIWFIAKSSDHRCALLCAGLFGRSIVREMQRVLHECDAS